MSQNPFVRVKVLPVKRMLTASSRFPSAIMSITGCECHYVWWPSTHFNVTASKLPVTLVFSIRTAFLHLKQNINSCESISQNTINMHDEEIFSSSSSSDSSLSSDVSRSPAFNDSSRGSSISEDKNESSRKSGSHCFLSGHSGTCFTSKEPHHGSVHEFCHPFVCWHSQYSTLMSLLPFLRPDLASPKPIHFFWIPTWLA